MKTTRVSTSRLLITASAVALCAFTIVPARVHASAPQYTVTVLDSLDDTTTDDTEHPSK